MVYGQLVVYVSLQGQRCSICSCLLYICCVVVGLLCKYFYRFGGGSLFLMFNPGLMSGG